MATFVLVHGACHGGWCWEKVVPLLQAHGHTAHAPDLPGLGKDHTPPANVTLPDNVEKISRLLDKTEEPVVLVGHALGGVTIGQVAEARRRKLKALVYVCGLMPPPGTASRELTAGDPDMLFRRSREVSPGRCQTSPLLSACRPMSSRRSENAMRSRAFISMRGRDVPVGSGSDSTLSGRSTCYIPWPGNEHDR